MRLRKCDFASVDCVETNCTHPLSVKSTDDEVLKITLLAVIVRVLLLILFGLGLFNGLALALGLLGLGALRLGILHIFILRLLLLSSF